MNYASACGYRLGFVLVGPEADCDIAVAWHVIVDACDSSEDNDPLFTVSFPKYIQLRVSAFVFIFK